MVMTYVTHSVPELSLMTDDLLVETISFIEQVLPGWWWSISQTQEETCVSVGPGRKGPHPQDVVFSQTKKGDSGFLFHYVYAIYGTTRFDFIKQIRQFILLLNSDRGLEPGQLYQRPSISLAVPYHKNPYRYQTDFYLEKLRASYIKAVKDLGEIYSKGYRTKQIYLGSCDFSVDCSLRGENISTGEKFDVSEDIIEPVGIHRSLNECVIKLKSLTT